MEPVAPPQRTVEVTTFLRGQPTPSRKEIRERENHRALGGMRTPHRARGRLPEATRVGAVLAGVIQRHIDVNAVLLEPAQALISGHDVSLWLGTRERR